MKLLPGAARLVQHLAQCQVPLAIATSTPRASFEKKMAAHGAVLALFSAVVCGDDAGVSAGKPAPDIYQEAARQLGVACGDALAIEDAPSGIEVCRLTPSS